MSNETKFTPGPWEVRLEQVKPGCNAMAYTAATEEYDVVSPMLCIRNEADAQLIAAAPDLYEALDRMIANFESLVHDQYDGCHALEGHLSKATAAKAALAKARGES